MKKLLCLLSLVLFVCACDPANTSSKNSSSDRFPVPPISVSNSVNNSSTDKNDDVVNSTEKTNVSVSQGNSSNSSVNESVGSDNKESVSVSTPENKVESSSSSSTPAPEEEKPSNVLPGGGFGGLH